MAKHVVVEPYNEAWKKDFAVIKAELEPALGGLALRIEHVGSTSVPGLSAKPIIDIDVVIDRYIEHKSPFIESVYKEIGL